MRNASEASCREGYEFYVRRAGITTHDIVNEWLVEHHFDEISPRMFKHYQRMYDDKQFEYVTLNKYEYVVSVG